MAITSKFRTSQIHAEIRGRSGQAIAPVRNTQRFFAMDIIGAPLVLWFALAPIWGVDMVMQHLVSAAFTLTGLAILQIGATPGFSRIHCSETLRELGFIHGGTAKSVLRPSPV